LVRHPEAVLQVTLEMVVADLSALSPAICCLQVGANDGVSCDPIYPLVDKYNVYGILVEPQADAYERLRTNYAQFGSRFKFLNAAIGPRNQSVPMYRVRPGSDGPTWLQGIASFRQDVFMRHLDSVPNLTSFMETIQVPCLPFSEVFGQLGLEHVDLLQIDTEGYDAEILRLFDVPARQPAIIHFEHKHLSRIDLENCVNMLVDLEYRVAVGPGDTIAYRRPLNPSAVHENGELRGCKLRPVTVRN
jgi:FkbM family methyltransferase